MAQQSIENIRRTVALLDGLDAGLNNSRDWHRIPLQRGKAGNASKKLVRCRFCPTTTKKITSVQLAKHTMQAHGDTVRLLDNSEHSATLFELGFSAGGKKGMYMMNRAFYNLLQHVGAVSELPVWTELRDLKTDSDVQLLARGEPFIDQTVFKVPKSPLEFVEPVQGLENGELGLSLASCVSKEVSKIDSFGLPIGGEPVFEHEVFLDVSESETHSVGEEWEIDSSSLGSSEDELPSDLENHCDGLQEECDCLSCLQNPIHSLNGV